MKNLTLFHSEDFNLVFFKLLFANTVLKISLVHRSDLQSLITTSTFLDSEITILRPKWGNWFVVTNFNWKTKSVFIIRNVNWSFLSLLCHLFRVYSVMFLARPVIMHSLTVKFTSWRSLSTHVWRDETHNNLYL